MPTRDAQAPMWRRGTPSLAFTAATSTHTKAVPSVATVRGQPPDGAPQSPRSRPCTVTSPLRRPSPTVLRVDDGPRELRVVQRRVGAVAFQQFGVRALLDDRAGLHHQNQ